MFSRPPDINILLSAKHSSPPHLWNSDPFDMLDVGLGVQINDPEAHHLQRTVENEAKGWIVFWGAWFFFSYYFKPVPNEKSKTKLIRDSNGVLGYDKSDLVLEVFLVQHDMKNMYMWVFKERPKNASGKMQLRSYMNEHSRQEECKFSFSVDKRKHYGGLSNPQCIHGLEVVCSPNLNGLNEEEQKRWRELTCDLNFSIPPEAIEFCSWRNLTNTAFELEIPIPLLKTNTHSHSKKLLNGPRLNLSTRPSNHANGGGMDISALCHKRKKDLFLHGNDDDCCLLMNQPNGRVQDTKIHPI
nr:uncharacterized protein LOC107411074 [Ziziphus jujuba var. spinosa]